MKKSNQNRKPEIIVLVKKCKTYFVENNSVAIDGHLETDRLLQFSSELTYMVRNNVIENMHKVSIKRSKFALSHDNRNKQRILLQNIKRTIIFDIFSHFSRFPFIDHDFLLPVHFTNLW